jgi:hypothetical protein
MTTVAGCPVHGGFDPLGDAFLRDPNAHMHDLPPVFHAPSLDYYVVTATRTSSACSSIRRPSARPTRSSR